MDEYISIEAAVDAGYLSDWYISSVGGEPPIWTDAHIDELLNDFIVIPRDTKTADVQPVKRGEWDFRGYQLFKCTNCKEIFTQNQLEAMQNHIDQEEFTFPNFCPNCGADMRGDTNG